MVHLAIDTNTCDLACVGLLYGSLEVAHPVDNTKRPGGSVSVLSFLCMMLRVSLNNSEVSVSGWALIAAALALATTTSPREPVPRRCCGCVPSATSRHRRIVFQCVSFWILPCQVKLRHLAATPTPNELRFYRAAVREQLPGGHQRFHKGQGCSPGPWAAKDQQPSAFTRGGAAQSASRLVPWLTTAPVKFANLNEGFRGTRSIP